jgi:hypothetical protein
MTFIAAVLIFILCFAGMAAGLIIAKKVLKKGCSTDPDSCACRRDGKDPSSCDS